MLIIKSFQKRFLFVLDDKGMYVFIVIGDIRLNKIVKLGSCKIEQGCLINIVYCNFFNKCINNFKIVKLK